MKPEVANGVLQQAVLLRKNIEKNFILLGKYLYEISENKLWDGVYDSFGHFVEGGLKLSRANASKLMAVYRMYVLTYSIPEASLMEAGITNLYVALPLISRGENPEEVVKKAATLTRSEIMQERAANGEEECAHTETITICAVCHRRI